MTIRLSRPPGPVHHGQMARLTAGNGKNRQPRLAGGAGPRGETRIPGQISRRGCLLTLLALVITAAVAAWAALAALHRVFPAPPAVWSAGGEQLAQLSSLQGTWQDSAGGKMIFTSPRFTATASGGITAGGTVTFAGPLLVHLVAVVVVVDHAPQFLALGAFSLPRVHRDAAAADLDRDRIGMSAQVAGTGSCRGRAGRAAGWPAEGRCQA
jgi:hypothetical protein